jgi:hypothetical protein
MTYFSRPLRPSFHRLNTLTLAAAIRVHREIHITKTTTTRYDFRPRHKRGVTAVAITRLPTYRSIVPPRRRWAVVSDRNQRGQPGSLDVRWNGDGSHGPSARDRYRRSGQRSGAQDRESQAVRGRERDAVVTRRSCRLIGCTSKTGGQRRRYFLSESAAFSVSRSAIKPAIPSSVRLSIT